MLVRTRELDTGARGLGPADLIGLLPQADPEQAQLWIRRNEGLVGWGEAARISTRGPERFTEAVAQWQELCRHLVVRDEVKLPGTGALAFGAFTFARTSAAESVLVVPRIVIGTRDGRTWITTITELTDLSPAPDLATLRHEIEPEVKAGRLEMQAGALTAEQWVQQVEQVIDRIRAGDVAKVVMARDERAQLSEPVDARHLLSRLARDYPTCWTFAVDGLVGATPELLVRRDRGLVSSRVLAGTIRRSGDDAADLARAGSLARSSKDLEEHEFAVESLTQSLSPFASTTNTPDAPFVLHLPNVMHLASDVTAVLDAEHAQMSALELAAKLHPTAAVCGTPTPRAADVIAEHEQMDRERYAGPVGWIGADGDGEFGIALRCAQVSDAGRALRLFAGCGIVAASDPAAELNESEAKLEPMRTALA